MGAAKQAFPLVLVLSALCPAAQSTCYEPPQGGVCRGSGPFLAFQPTLPIGISCNSGRRRGVLALSSGLREWFGFGRDEKREKWKQSVTETNGPGLTDEEKLQAARLRRRALVVQDPTYRAKLQKQGTLPVEDPESLGSSSGSQSYSTEQTMPRGSQVFKAGGSRVFKTDQLPPIAGPQTPKSAAQKEQQQPWEDPADVEARRQRQLELQRDAARTLGKNAVSFLGGANASSKRSGSAASVERSGGAASLGSSAPARTGSQVVGVHQIDSTTISKEPLSNKSVSQSAEGGVSVTRLTSMREPPEPPKPPPPKPSVGASSEPTRGSGRGEEAVNYREMWREAANRNLFNILSRPKKSTSTSSRGDSNAAASSASSGVGAASGVPANEHRDAEASSVSVSAEDSTEDFYDEQQFEALPVLQAEYINKDKYAATARSTVESNLDALSRGGEGGGSSKEVAESGGQEELPEVTFVGGEAVVVESSGSGRHTQLASPDFWKVIAPKGLVVHSGPGDDYKPLGRLIGMQIVEVDAEQGVWLKLAQSVGGQDGWVRKEEGRGKRGGGLTRRDAALMVKQGKKLGFDSKEMSKWRILER